MLNTKLCFLNPVLLSLIYQKPMSKKLNLYTVTNITILLLQLSIQSFRISIFQCKNSAEKITQRNYLYFSGQEMHTDISISP